MITTASICPVTRSRHASWIALKEGPTLDATQRDRCARKDGGLARSNRPSSLAGRTD